MEAGRYQHCLVCGINYKYSETSHLHTESHKKALLAFLVAQQECTRLLCVSLRQPIKRTPLGEARGFWCAFCQCELDERAEPFHRY